MKYLIAVLESSINRSGAATPLTLGHLLNLLKLAEKLRCKVEQHNEAEHLALPNEINPHGQDYGMTLTTDQEAFLSTIHLHGGSCSIHERHKLATAARELAETGEVTIKPSGTEGFIDVCAKGGVAE